MSAWPGAHAGFGVDGAAPGMSSAEEGSTPLCQRRLEDRRPSARFVAAARIHAGAFDRPVWRSLLNLATAGRLLVAGGAVCSVGRVAPKRGRRACWAVLLLLVAMPSLILSASSSSHLTGLGSLLWIATAGTLNFAGIVVVCRSIVVSRRWKFDDGAIEITNLATASPGNGDAGRLIDVVIERAEIAGRCVVLWVRSSNERACRLYRSRGFVEARDVGDPSGDFALVRPPPPARTHGQRFDLGVVTVIAVASAAASAAIAESAGRPLVPVAVMLALSSLTVASAIDRRTLRIPNVALLFAAALGVVACDAADVGVVPCAVSAVAASAPLLLIHLLDPAAMGFGDVKFAAAAGLAVAAVEWRSAILIPLIALGTALLIRIFAPRRARAFAPALLAGLCVAILAGTIGPFTRGLSV